MDSPTLSPREKAAVLWAEHVTRNTAKTRDDVFQEVRRHYDDREFVELTMVITYGRRQDPENLKNYLEGVVADWPESFPGPEEDDKGERHA